MTPFIPHATLQKFGYPDTLLHQGEQWAVLVRPAQPTLGSLVLCALSDVQSYAALPAAAFIEQRQLSASIEMLLRSFAQADKINYLMLMMVDPHVHFHVLPRYATARSFGGREYVDSGWPGLPDLVKNVPASSDLIAALQQEWR